MKEIVETCGKKQSRGGLWSAGIWIIINYQVQLKKGTLADAYVYT